MRALDPLFALIVVAVLALPYAVWLMRAETLVLPALPQVAELNARALHAAWLLGGLVLGAAAIPALTFLNTGLFVAKSEEAPIIYRPPVEPLARNFVYFFALAPALGAVLISGLLGLDAVVGGAGVVLVMSGLAVVVVAGDLIAMRRARMLRTVWAGRRRGARSRRRARRAVPALDRRQRDRDLDAGARDLGLLRRELCPPHQSSPARGRRRDPACEPDHAAFRPAASLHRCRARADAVDVNQAKFSETGGVVVWRASDTAGTPPPEILARFPGIVPEVPRAFEWLVTGRQQLLRIGWAIVRPKGT